MGGVFADVVVDDLVEILDAVAGQISLRRQQHVGLGHRRHGVLEHVDGAEDTPTARRRPVVRQLERNGDVGWRRRHQRRLLLLLLLLLVLLMLLELVLSWWMW